MPTATFLNLSQKKQKHVLAIAAAEFAHQPYEVASISRIVRAANISKSSFYQYFADKKELYQTLIETGTEAKLKLLNELPAPDPASDLFDYLKWQFLGTVTFELRNPDLAGVLNRAFIEEVPFPEMREELRRRGTTQFFKQLIAQGITHGDVAFWVDPDIAAFLLETMFYQFGKYLIRRLDLKDTDDLKNTIMGDGNVAQILENLMDLLEAGMKRKPEQRTAFPPKD
jgi:AcrR family transcriptional regulator